MTETGREPETAPEGGEEPGRGDGTKEPSKEPGRKAVRLIGIAAVIVCLVALALLLFFKHRSENREARGRQNLLQSGARVEVAIVSRAPSERKITVTAEAHPYASVTLYSKVSGYLKEMRVDKGDRVTEGELLAVILSPELDNQYRAALVEAENKRRFAQRERLLLKDGIVSKQEAENAVADARSAEETAAALKREKDYLLIKAPFDGTVTARFADPGALMQSAATGQTSALPLVTVSRTDRLRIYAYLDQKSAAAVSLGDPCLVSDAARPDVKIPARVKRISGELDPRSRTMLVELELANTGERIIAGSFVEVTLSLALPPYLQLPASAVFVAKEKSLVAVVGSGHRISFRPVTIADSDGKMVLISEGVEPGEMVALNPGTGLTEGALVQPVMTGGGGEKSGGGAGTGAAR